MRDLETTGRPEGASRKAILQVNAQRRVDEKRYASTGLSVLDSTDPNRVVAYARDTTLSRLTTRIAEYGTGDDLPPREPDAKGSDDGPRAPHEDIFDNVDGFERRSAEARITPRLTELLAEGKTADFDITLDLYSPDDGELRADWIAEVSSLAERSESTADVFDDPAIGVTLVRILGASAELVQQLSRLDQVETLDAIPTPALTRPAFAALQDLEDLDADIVEPDANAPAIGLIDSGLALGHPLLQGAVLGADVLHPSLPTTGGDEFGHGTLVGGLALFGDVLDSARHGLFAAPCPIASVRIFDANGEIPRTANPAVLIRDALEHLVAEYDCRVICLSLGDQSQPFTGGKASPLAALIDDLARALDVCVVVPTGNIEHESMLAPAQLLARWPDYLSDPGHELLSPSQAALAITVGATADHDVTDLNDPAAAAAARAGGPAPYTRRGPGIRESQKPEVSANGGNWIYDRGTGEILDDTATAVVSLSARPDLLFDTAIGSSFAAGAVTHVLGQIARRYPDASAAALRALLLQGCRAHDSPHAEPNFAGYGAPDLDACLDSTDQRVVLLAESSLRPDGFHVYRFPADTDFFTQGGTRTLTTALAFDPPVRYRRYDYLGLQMEMAVVRGLSEDEVFHLASSDNKGKLSELSKKYAKMQPPITRNSRGVNQVGTYSSSRKPNKQHQDDWFVVVRSVNKWTRDRSPQPYALAVAAHVEQSVALYSQLRAKVDIRTKLRARV